MRIFLTFVMNEVFGDCLIVNCVFCEVRGVRRKASVRQCSELVDWRQQLKIRN